MRNDADRRFSLIVRARGHCEAGAFDGITCSPMLQCAHLVPRRYLSVRWDFGNAACLCSAHHAYLTHFPLAHQRFCAEFLGEREWEALKSRAELARGAPDYESLLEHLKRMALA